MFRLKPGDILNGLWASSHKDVSSKGTGGQWISVKDKHPKHGDIVLCALFDPYDCDYEYDVLQWDDPVKVWVGRYPVSDDDDSGLVTHWMPLPDPPKEE